MKLPLAALASGLLLASLPAIAADQGFYLGAGVGQMTTDVDDYDFDESDFGFKVFGGYKFLPWLGVEGMYINGGKPEDKQSYDSGPVHEEFRLTVEVESLVAAVVFSLPLGENFELFLKPGFAYWDSTTSGRYSYDDGTFSFEDSASIDDSGSAFFLGGGAGFNFSENLGVRVEYEWFEVAPEWDSDSDEFVDELDASAGFLSASFVYTF